MVLDFCCPVSVGLIGSQLAGSPSFGLVLIVLHVRERKENAAVPLCVWSSAKTISRDAQHEIEKPALQCVTVVGLTILVDSRAKTNSTWKEVASKTAMCYSILITWVSRLRDWSRGLLNSANKQRASLTVRQLRCGHFRIRAEMCTEAASREPPTFCATTYAPRSEDIAEEDGVCPDQDKHPPGPGQQPSSSPSLRLGMTRTSGEGNDWYRRQNQGQT